MDVVESELFGILNHLDLGSPQIFDEAKLEESRCVLGRRQYLRAARREVLHPGVEIGVRQADVIDDAANARLYFIGLDELDQDLVEVDQLWCPSLRRPHV